MVRMGIILGIIWWLSVHFCAFGVSYEGYQSKTESSRVSFTTDTRQFYRNVVQAMCMNIFLAAKHRTGWSRRI